MKSKIIKLAGHEGETRRKEITWSVRFIYLGVSGRTVLKLIFMKKDRDGYRFIWLRTLKSGGHL
jgi:hypothetical protein